VSNPPDRKSEICSAEIAGCAVNPPPLRPPSVSARIRTYPHLSAPLRAYQATKKRTIISKNIQQ